MNTRAILWAARFTGTLLLAFLLFMLIGHLVGDANGPEGMRFTSTREVIAFAFFPCTTMLGLVLAFKWDLLGGTIAVGSMIALFLIMPGTMIFRFMVMLIPGLLYLVHGWMVRRTSPTLAGPFVAGHRDGDPRHACDQAHLFLMRCRVRTTGSIRRARCTGPHERPLRRAAGRGHERADTKPLHAAAHRAAGEHQVDAVGEGVVPSAGDPCDGLIFVRMRLLLLFIQAFLALTALGGGYALMAAPDGSLLQLPREFMHSALFSDFFWPGVILFTVLGLGHVVGFVLTLRRAASASRAALLLGLGTLIWIGAQVLMTDLFWLQGLIAGLGGLEIVGGRRIASGAAC